MSIVTLFNYYGTHFYCTFKVKPGYRGDSGRDGAVNYGIERGMESEAAGRVGKGFPQVSSIIYCLCCKYLNQFTIFLQM